MAAFRTGWPTYNYAASECAAAPPLYYVAPCFYDAGVGNQIRKFLLDRSVFDLVDVNKFLHLTDPRLLGWYLSLSVEDRTDIEDQGGLQQFLLRHPALEVSQHYVYVKCEAVQMNVSSAQQTVMSNRSITQRATYFRSDCERLPNNMWVTLNRLRYRGDESQRHPTAFNCSTTQEPNQQPGGTAFCHLSEQRPSWQTPGDGPAAPPSFSVEPHRQGGQPELRSCTATPKGDKCDSTYADVSLSRSECPTGDEDVSPEYYSFNSTQMDATEYSEWSLCQPVEPEQNSSPLDPVEESSTAEGLQGHVLRGNESPEGDGEAGASFGDQSNSSIVVNDESILVCLTTKDVRTFQNRVHTESGAPKPDQSVTTADAAEHHSPPGRRVTTCDIMVGAEPATCAPAVGKTEDSPTADKHVNTEVYMSDLDYVAEEFTKLQKVQEQLQGQKKEMKSSGCKWTKECDCLQRAQRAELGLLALQYVMCKQHCWRLHYTSSEGGQLAPMKNTNPSADFANLLQKLESDYNQMRDEIMAGTPLEELKPLCVDLKQVKSHASYNPAKIVREVQENIPSRSSEEPRKPKTSAGEKGRPNDRSTGGSQSTQRKGKENPIKSENSAAGRALADAPLNASKPGEKLTAACRELGPCEAWFDAEENPVEAQPGQEPTGVLGEQTSTKSAGEESELLCVSNLPSDATESDVMLWFEKHNASEASVSAFNTDFRVAIVMVSGPQSAEAAVRELHGCCVQGNTLRVEHIRRAVGGRRASASISGPQSSKDSTAPETSKTERKLMSHPPLGGSVGDGKVVVPPTAKGTSAPRHFDPMGSFHTLMAELTQRHPDAGRQGIVDALMELKAEQQGALSGLPLSTIREMTSELLTRSERAAKP